FHRAIPCRSAEQGLSPAPQTPRISCILPVGDVKLRGKRGKTRVGPVRFEDWPVPELLPPRYIRRPGFCGRRNDWVRQEIKYVEYLLHIHRRACRRKSPAGKMPERGLP